MAYCFFDDEIKNTYSCEYEIENEKLNIEVDFGYADREILTKIENLYNALHMRTFYGYPV